MKGESTRLLPTGLSWPSGIPSSWELVKISSVFRERNETVSDKDFPPLSVTMKGIVPQLETAAKTDNGDSRKKVAVGDFVINSRSDRKGSAGVSLYEGSVSIISTVLKPSNKVVGRFVDYLLTNYYFQEEFYRFGKGIVADLWSTKYSSMKGMCIPLPPLSEQRTIAGYLDEKTAEIARFIQKKTELIALLKEQKASLVQQAVTKGIYALAEYRDCGISWLNRIPSHWKVWKLSRITSTTSGSTPESGNRAEYYDGQINWVRSTDLNDGVLIDLPVKITKKALAETSCKVLPRNSVLIAMYGGDGTIGKHSILGVEAAVNQAVCGILPTRYVLPEFMFFYVKFLRPIWMLYADGARKDPNISQEIIRQIKIAVPPIKEQKAIVHYIRAEHQKIDDIIARTEREIVLVKELQQSIIAEAVTGKIKIA